MKTFEAIDFILPDWSACALINGDFSGLNEQDKQELNTFIEETVKTYGHALFSLPSDDEIEQGFKHSNDLNNLGSNCIKLTLIFNK